ncbi:MAG TPA: DUF423 domain-containing protein [Burkholderiaceae bacterium]|nr:DUF423 domain-containing protein [Burkholderiaceae bacterium]
MSSRTFAVAGALLAFAGVAAGAFGAHALKVRLAPDALAVFETGVRYHLAHALALFAVAWISSQWPSRAARISGWLFVAGVVLFSGSLYVLALTGARIFGVITPLGGVSLLAGWLTLAWAAWRGRLSS